MAETKAAAELAFEAFIESYALKYDKAADCLAKDRDTLLAFYDFPAEHWKHLRTTNPIESTFATVRHRTIRSKGCLSNRTALTMVFKLIEGAQKSWRRLDGHNQLPKLVLSYAGIWVTGRSGGDGFWQFDYFDSVLESDTSDDLRQLICAFQPSPGFRCGAN